MNENVLYNKNGHVVMTFDDLVTGEGIQSNQLAIFDHGHSALFDPGGDLTYMPLTMSVNKFVKTRDIDYIFATHQDPDIVSSFDKWLMYSDAKIVISKLWQRFIPHLVPGYMKEKVEGRIIPVPDQGMDFKLGDATIKALPAHFLHSVGNFHFYDTVSKILFSGDVGASMVDNDAHLPIEDFRAHIPNMLGFHKRYMVSNKVCRLWANMIRHLDVEMMVPQHGRPFVGREKIGEFLQWLENLECGVDNLHEGHSSIP